LVAGTENASWFDELEALTDTDLSDVETRSIAIVGTTRLLGKESHLGTLETGKRIDLVLVDESLEGHKKEQEFLRNCEGQRMVKGESENFDFPPIPLEGPPSRIEEDMKFMKITVSFLLLLILATPLYGMDNPYLTAGKNAAQWIRASTIQTAQGTQWPSDPSDIKTVDNSLYEGVSGDVLFFLEAYRATGDQTYLKDARSGGGYLLASLDKEQASGLYDGLAGIGFTLTEIFKLTKEEKYKQGALHCVDLLQKRGNKAGKGIEWSETTDIISGTAGIGLFLLYAEQELGYSSAKDTAILAGNRLLETAQPSEGGLKWAMNPKFPRLMPNFAHGTAGVAYFLATLYQHTHKTKFLEAALSGGKYLLAVAKTEGEICLVFHNEPDGKDLYYLGWCHGPAGTARLFYRLYQVTGDKTWMAWVRKSARGILESGIPEERTPGFWNNVSRCCGSAGVAEFFLDLYRITKDREYLAFSKRVTDNLLSRGTREGNGMKWIQAEHRVKPELLIAQTGLMQGASGIGMWLFKLGSFEMGRLTEISFPDSPF
jgi:lantibiotic modifying enzyme